MDYKELLNARLECPFCTGKDPVIAQNALAFMTYALVPYHPHHLLVLPKRHLARAAEITTEELNAMWDLQLKGFAALQKLGYENVALLFREGKEQKGGKTLPHVHFHLIPKLSVGPNTPKDTADRHVLTPEEAAQTVRDITTALSLKH